MSKFLKPWKFIYMLEYSAEGCEFALFTDREHLEAYKAGNPADVRYVICDVAFGEGSSWIEYGPLQDNNPISPLCDDNILSERENIVPWKSKTKFDAFYESLET